MPRERGIAAISNQTQRNWRTVCFAGALQFAAALTSGHAAAQSAGTPVGAASSPAQAPQIVSVKDQTSGSGTVRFEDELAVKLDGHEALDPAHYTLFLNGRAIDGLASYYDSRSHALVFWLERNAANAAAWQSVLGAPTWFETPLAVTLGEHALGGANAAPSIFGANAEGARISFELSTPLRLFFGVLGAGAAFALVLWRPRRRMLLKDNLVPQIDPRRQTFSLGRCQMAFWFCLIFASYIFLYVVLDDPNTLSVQALTLMGISGVTAYGAIAVDAAKDTPDDTENRGLQLLGIKSYADVARIKQETTDRRTTLSNPAGLSAGQIALLNSEIVDRQLVLQKYEDTIKPFLSAGFFSDILSDQGGTALHRLQMLCWTLLLGLIFVVGVWQHLAMPQLSATLLALMGVSSAGYVGFKIPEVQQ